MNWTSKLAETCRVLAIAAAIAGSLGCQTSKQQRVPSKQPSAGQATARTVVNRQDQPVVRLASHRQEASTLPRLPPPDTSGPESIRPADAQPLETLADLEIGATANNPTLQRMQQEAAAEWAKTGYIDKLPDPTIGSMFFGSPMNFVPDRQLAEVQVMQMIPWLGRLRAEAQRAQMEALVAENQFQAERQRVIGDVRTAWYKLYVLGKQVEITEADKSQLESLIKTANARIATGASQPGDVLMATLELSNLEEQLLSYRQQLAATTADLNRLAGRAASVPIVPPTKIDAQLPEWDHDLLRQIALETQPELAAARLRIAATRWGIEVARLKRRPDLTFGAGWMVMAPDPADRAPGAGDDAWTLGVTASIPLSRGKYDAMVSEASREHAAAHASEDEVILRLDALLRDLWEQARASQQTVELYEKTILPQARQTYEADQKSLVNSTVTFDRVIRDFRTLLTLEMGYHRALAQLATSLARIRQTVGVDLLASPESRSPTQRSF